MTTKPAANIPKPKDVGEDRAEAGDRKLNLLVIEDDEQILEAITEYFSRAGYTVQTGGTASRACSQQIGRAHV
jgi:response regulator RpfG family c-di-GMP phosphodiesterase